MNLQSHIDYYMTKNMKIQSIEWVKLKPLNMNLMVLYMIPLQDMLEMTLEDHPGMYFSSDKNYVQ